MAKKIKCKKAGDKGWYFKTHYSNLQYSKHLLQVFLRLFLRAHLFQNYADSIDYFAVRISPFKDFIS